MIIAWFDQVTKYRPTLTKEGLWFVTQDRFCGWSEHYL